MENLHERFACVRLCFFFISSLTALLIQVWDALAVLRVFMSGCLLRRLFPCPAVERPQVGRKSGLEGEHGGRRFQTARRGGGIFFARQVRAFFLVFFYYLPREKQLSPCCSRWKLHYIYWYNFLRSARVLHGVRVRCIYVDLGWHFFFF